MIVLITRLTSSDYALGAPHSPLLGDFSSFLDEDFMEL